MPKPIPTLPDYEPPADVRNLMTQIRALTAPRDGGTPDEYTASIKALQWLQNEVLEEWLRELARAQGAGALSHRALVEVTNYKAHRNVQHRVYEGRTLLDSAT